MTDLSQPNFTQQELLDLQRLRALTFAFLQMIANLDANEQNNDHNEQFNKIHAETKAILSRYGLKLDVPRAVTTSVVAERGQKVSTRLSGIVILGVILVLLGLGINSIILEDVIINSLGCLISTGGMLLVVGAFVVWGATAGRRKLTNLGDLYLRGDGLLQQLDQILSSAIPEYATPPVVKTPNIPSAATLTLDSLEKQAADWQEKLGTLNEQRQILGLNAPVEVTTTINYVQRELDRVEYELVNLRESVEFPVTSPPEPAWTGGTETPPPPVRSDSEAVRVAQAFTQEMPPIQPESDPEPSIEPEEDTQP